MRPKTHGRAAPLGRPFSFDAGSDAAAVIVTFHPLAETATADLVRLLNDPDVARHMPLSTATWDEEKAIGWAKGKDLQWQRNGFGPWAIRIDGAFAGWGGFQKEGDEADLGLVLFPRYWGSGLELSV
jgi:RimJ/RimL family protein N-acetyltransferase